MSKRHLQVNTRGFASFKRAIAKNPGVVQARGRAMINRGINVYRRVIEGSPWRVGQSGGGVPVDTGRLKQSHRYRVMGLKGIIDFDHNPAPADSDSPYGAIVHGDKPSSVKMRGMDLHTRPWLNYAVGQSEAKVKALYQDFLDDVIENLS